jgi:hypothetical protein
MRFVMAMVISGLKILEADWCRVGWAYRAPIALVYGEKMKAIRPRCEVVRKSPTIASVILPPPLDRIAVSWLRAGRPAPAALPH